MLEEEQRKTIEYTHSAGTFFILFHGKFDSVRYYFLFDKLYYTPV